MAVTFEIPEDEILVTVRLAPKCNYVGAMSHYPMREGENWHRGNDLPDGPDNSETVDLIGNAIIDLLAFGAEPEAPLSAKYLPGQRVAVGDGSIIGTVESVKFPRNAARPLYEVEWMHEGDLIARWFHEQDIRKDS